MKKSQNIQDDKYNVESSSANDWDGYAAMEMTGMMYKPPVSKAQLEAYKSLYPFSPEQYEEN